jgi:hypothetical protein
MKNHFKITLVIFVMFLFTGTLSAQLKFGAKAGLNISTQKVSVLGFSLVSKAKVGPYVGIFAEYELNDEFILQPELAYSSLGSSFDFDGESSSTNLNYIVLPVILKYRISNLSIGVGPQLGLLLSANSKYDGIIEEATDEFKSTDFSALLNADYEVNENIVIGLRYQIGLSNISPTTSNSVSFFGSSATAQNNSFQFSVGYKF